jgi:hypothetical protein
MKKYIIIFMVMITQAKAFAWHDETTHLTITRFTVEKYFSVDYLNKFLTDNIALTSKNWIQIGSIREDAGLWYHFLNGTARSLNHFHDPTKSLELAGLSDIGSGLSAIIWAQDASRQSAATGGDWNWNKVREHYLKYLTSQNKSDKEANQARMLMGLGYQMHLVQDMSQPNHVRNDTHIRDGNGTAIKTGLETWVKNHEEAVNNILIDPASQQIILSIAVV